MALPGPTKHARDHELAQALELARRQQGLSTSDLATALYLSPRTIRRYLNGERRPARDTVAAWEQACGGADGRLVAVYDRPVGGPSLVEEPGRPTGRASRAGGGRLRARGVAISAAAAVCVALLAIGAVLIDRSTGDDPGRAVASDPPRASSAVLHRFTPSYVGDVWIRITPSRDRAGKPHQLGLRWGPLRQDVSLGRIAESRTVFFGKNNPDDVPLRVNVEPAARIAFFEGDPPAGALDIKAGWQRGG